MCYNIKENAMVSELNLATATFSSLNTNTTNVEQGHPILYLIETPHDERRKRKPIMGKIYETNIVETASMRYSETVFKRLLIDRTTRKNIIWATEEYSELGKRYLPKSEILRESITGVHSGVIKPRVTKAIEAQADRTKKKAEVMTPSWICNKMNNVADEVWFGRPDVFNAEHESSWTTTSEPIAFAKLGDWKRYVDDRRLEITCGEAPFITSRYDTTTGEIIPVVDRIGLLDRKLRVVGENAHTKEEWLRWALRALQATYGYEWQGDNLVIARLNVLQTWAEHLDAKWHCRPTEHEAGEAALVISWNLWQMDGLKGTVPLGTPQEEFPQLSMLDLMGNSLEASEFVPYCNIFDWRARKPQTYNSLKDEAGENE